MNAAFIASYKKSTGKDVKVDQSHSGSSAQGRAVNDGLDADVVTMNATTNVDFLASSGIVAKPKTGGNSRMAYLAAWGCARKKGGTDAQAAEFAAKHALRPTNAALFWRSCVRSCAMRSGRPG